MSGVFVPTPEHEAFFDWIKRGPKGSSALLEAVAGSGKSSTLIEATRLTAPSPTLYLAFNKSAVEEANQRGLGEHVAAQTLNGYGYRALLKARPGVRPDKRQNSEMIARAMGLASRPDGRTRGHLLSSLDRQYLLIRDACDQLMSKAKASGLVPRAAIEQGIGVRTLVDDTADNWAALAEAYEIDPPGKTGLAELVDIVRLALVYGLQDTTGCDFDDQIYATVALGLKMPVRYPWVFVDEAQDISQIQRALLAAALAPGGRLVAVGDRNQAIYGFRGADSTSLDRIAEEFGAVPFPLTVSYRCPKIVVQLAQRFVPQIQHAPAAKIGAVTVAASDLGDLPADSWRPGADLVVCRTNAPLIRLAHRLMRLKVPCVVLGRDFGKGLLALLRKLKPYDLESLEPLLRAWAAKETAKALDKGRDSRAQAIEDQVETLLAFASEASDLAGLEVDLTQMFSDADATGSVRLSSIHRAKGSEAERVFVLDPHTMPSRWAKRPWQQEQEQNLIYVAVTRAKQELVFGAFGRPSETPRWAV